MLRGGEEEVAELAEGVRPDGGLLVVGDHPLHRPLARVHVEVIEPEVHHHFLELPLREHGAGELGRLQLDRDAGRPPLERCDLANFLLAHLARLRLGEKLGIRLGIAVKEIGHAHGQGRKGLKGCFEAIIRDAAGIELTVDIGGEADLPHALEIPRARAIAEAIQHVDDALVSDRVDAGSAMVARAGTAGADTAAAGTWGLPGALEHPADTAPTKARTDRLPTSNSP
jgi:hypothetical protein